MKMNASNRLIVSILAIAAAAVAFWVLALGPKREEADKLSGQVEQLQVALSEAQLKASQAAEAKREFPGDYRQLVVLGQAVPAGDETSSLFVELGHVATRSKVKFNSIQLTGTGETSTPTAVPSAPTAPSAAGSGAVPASATIPPTEAAASVLPLGASVGTAGLGVMPYSLTFSGNFFQIASFIKGIDSLVHSGTADVAVDGRLMTLNGFALNADSEREFPYLSATFDVTTYVTPPIQGITAGATPVAPAPSVATPTSTEAPTSESSPETVSSR